MFVPHNVISEIATYIAEFPHRRGSIFKLDQSNFRKVFKEMALLAGIPSDLAHSHVLRHTRVIKMLRAGVPVTVVQDQLGHVHLTTTGQRASGFARRILKGKKVRVEVMGRGRYGRPLAKIIILPEEEDYGLKIIREI